MVDDWGGRDYAIFGAGVAFDDGGEAGWRVGIEWGSGGGGVGSGAVAGDACDDQESDWGY